VEDFDAQPMAPQAPIVTRRPQRQRRPTAPEAPIVTRRPRRQRRPTAPEASAAPIAIPRGRRRLKIAVSLVVVVAGLLLLPHGQEVAETVYAPATRAGHDLAQVKQALQQQSDKTDKLTADLAQIKPATSQGNELASATTAQGVADKKVHRLVLQVNTNDPATMTLALNNATNVQQYYKDVGEKVEIEVVTFGPGLNMLRDDTSPVKDRIKAIADKTSSISFKACGNTQDNMRKAEHKEIPLISQATLVKSGVVRVVELQEEGWTYVRP
jgi:uncharacterized protein